MKTRRKNLLEKKKLSFHFLGFIVATAVTLLAFEWRTPVRHTLETSFIMDEVFDITEIIPVSIIPEKPQPKEEPIKAKDKLGTIIKQVDEVESKIEDDIIEDINPIDLTPFDDLFDDTNDKAENLDEVLETWAVSELPYLKSCKELGSLEERGVCSQNSMNEIFNRRMKYPKIAKDVGAQGRVFVSFVVDKNGKVSNIEVMNRAHIHPALADEAERIISQLPDFVPGHSGYRPVNVRYQTYINFVLR
jgi:periplasmic protein TonB